MAKSLHNKEPSLGLWPSGLSKVASGDETLSFHSRGIARITKNQSETHTFDVESSILKDV